MSGMSGLFSLRPLEAHRGIEASAESDLRTPLRAEFEQTSKAFQAALRPWIRRGILDGRALGWETWEEGAVKLE